MNGFGLGFGFFFDVGRGWVTRGRGATVAEASTEAEALGAAEADALADTLAVGTASGSGIAACTEAPTSSAGSTSVATDDGSELDAIAIPAITTSATAAATTAHRPRCERWTITESLTTGADVAAPTARIGLRFGCRVVCVRGGLSKLGRVSGSGRCGSVSPPSNETRLKDPECSAEILSGASPRTRAMYAADVLALSDPKRVRSRANGTRLS